MGAQITAVPLGNPRLREELVGAVCGYGLVVLVPIKGLPLGWMLKRGHGM